MFTFRTDKFAQGNIGFSVLMYGHNHIDPVMKTNKEKQTKNKS